MVFFCLFFSSLNAQWVIPSIPGPGPNSAASIGNNCFNLTTAGIQRGVVWNSNTINLNAAFDISFSTRFNTFGADGLALVLQSIGTNAYGAGGNALGYADAIPADINYSAISPSIAFELDTWDNSPVGVADIVSDHIAIHQNGNTSIALAGPISARPGNLDVTDNVCRYMRVTWNPATTTIRVYYDGNLRLTSNINIINTVFGGNPNVYWGFTGSSGGIAMQIQICVDANFAEAGPDRAVCENDTVQFAGSGGTSYSWTPIGNLNNPNIPNPIFTGNTPGNTQMFVDVTNVLGCVSRDSMLVTVAPRPSSITNGPFTTCIGSTLNVGAAAIPNYSYQWSPPTYLNNINTANPLFNANAQGIHPLQLIVIDNSTALGCRDTAITTVTVLDTPSVSLSASNASICIGQSTTISANGSGGGPFTFAWSTGAVGNNISTTAPGNYSVTVTGGNSCTATSSITISSLPSPIVNIGNDTTVCAGQALNLDAGSGFSNYVWNNGSSAQINPVVIAGNYTVTVTDGNGCIGIDSLLVTNFPISSVSIGPDTAICTGDSLQLLANPGFITYAWSNGTILPSTLVYVAGSYAVTVTDGNGCIAQDSMILGLNPLPNVNLGPDIVQCTGTAATLDAGAGFTTYNWSNGANTQTINSPNPGSFSVTVSNNLGCLASDTINFSWQGSLPVALIPDTSICDGDSILLDAGFPGATFVWSNGANSQQIFVNQAGQYGVTVTDPFGCMGNDSFFLSLNRIPAAYLGGDTSICLGTSLLLDAGNSASTYIWSTGQNSQQILVNSTGNYAVTVTNAFGCSTNDSINLAILPIPQPNLGPDLSRCPNDSSLLDPQITGTNYLWSNGSTTNTLITNQAGTFWVQVSDNNNCIGTDTINIVQLPSPIVDFDTLLANYCVSDPSVLLIGSPGGGTFSSNANAGVFSAQNLGVGSHTISYTFTDSIGCQGISIQSTNVVALPSQALAGPDLSTNGPINLAGNFPSIGNGHWEMLSGNGTFSSIFDPNASFEANGDGTIILSWVIENAPCPANRDTLQIIFESLVIPSGFSPNGDGVNDQFVIRGLEKYPEAKLSIFNRWGEKVWHKENYRNDWLGTNAENQPLSDDTYYYILEFGGKQSSSFLVLKR